MSTAVSDLPLQREMMPTRRTVPIERINVSAYKIHTDAPESDGTLEWNSTTLVLVEAQAAGITGIGYSYADTATAALIRDKLIDRCRAARGARSDWATHGALRRRERRIWAQAGAGHG